MPKPLSSSIKTASKIKRCIGNAVFIYASFFFLHTTVWGQHWTQVSLPNIYYEITPYFLNENIGFVFDVSSAGSSKVQPNLRRTTNGGISWTALRFFDDIGIPINQIYFVELNHGYAAALDGVYETKDMGNSWRKIYTGLPFSSVYAFANKVFAYGGPRTNYLGSLDVGPLVMTSDGNTWDTVIFTSTHKKASTMKPYVFGNKDNIVFAQNIDASDNMFLSYSTNNGKDWSSNKMDIPNGTWTMGLFSFPHCKDILRTYIAPLNPGMEDVYLIVHSSDFGAHWDTLDKPLEIGAWIAGNNCIQYVSNAQGIQNGVWRSADHAKSWKYIPGPVFEEIDDQDFHNLSVVGGGAVVYAGEFNFKSPPNNLWKTTDGGDGTLSAAALASSISLNHNLTVGTTICDTSFLGLFYENLSCNYTMLKDIKIDGLDSTQFSSQWIHHLACEGIPDTVLVKIFPLNSANNTLNIRARFVNDEFQTIDTSFSVTITPSAGSAARMYLKSLPITAFAGDTIEVPIYLNSAQKTTGLTSVDLSYSLNPILLTPINFKPINGITTDPVKITNATATVTLHFAPGFLFMGETEIGRLRCAVYLIDTLESDIILTGSAHSTGCIATSVDNNTIHFTLSQCGGSTLSNFMKYGKLYDITSINPNPAANSVHIELRNNGSVLHYELLDALGAMQKNGTTTGNELQLNLSGLSSGNYYFRLSGEGGIPVTKKIVIRK